MEIPKSLWNVPEILYSFASAPKQAFCRVLWNDTHVLLKYLINYMVSTSPDQCGSIFKHLQISKLSKIITNFENITHAAGTPQYITSGL